MEREIGCPIGDHNGCISVVVKVLKKFHGVRVETVLVASFLPGIVQDRADFLRISALHLSVYNVPSVTSEFFVETLA